MPGCAFDKILGNAAYTLFFDDANMEHGAMFYGLATETDSYFGRQNMTRPHTLTGGFVSPFWLECNGIGPAPRRHLARFVYVLFSVVSS